MSNKIITIGAIGRHIKVKGFDDLITSLNILKNNKIEFIAKIAGEGEETKNLKELSKNFRLEDRINFCGWIKNKEEFFNSIDIFCIPSKREPFGIVILEAMKYKKPIVATECFGALDIIENKVTGLLVKKENPESIASGIKELILNQDLRERLVENAYKELIKNYSEQKIGNELEKTLQDIVKNYK